MSAIDTLSDLDGRHTSTRRGLFSRRLRPLEYANQMHAVSSLLSITSALEQTPPLFRLPRRCTTSTQFEVPREILT